MRKLTVIVIVSFVICSCSKVTEQHENKDKTLKELAFMFQNPPLQYRPYVWWHWMGSNFSKEGITKDLEAMKDAGIGGYYF